MSGQDGSARDVLGYESSNHVVTAGLNVHPSDKLDLGFQLAWVSSQASLDPFSLAAPEFTARVPRMIEDFSQTPSYSDLDVQQIDGSLNAKYLVSDSIWVRGAYRYIDYADDAPYLYDTSGRNHLFTAALGWIF
jgi:hypothetical protein